MRLGSQHRGGVRSSPWSQVGTPGRRLSGTEEVASLPGTSLQRSTCSGPARPAVPSPSWARSLGRADPGTAGPAMPSAFPPHVPRMTGSGAGGSVCSQS